MGLHGKKASGTAGIIRQVGKRLTSEGVGAASRSTIRPCRSQRVGAITMNYSPI